MGEMEVKYYDPKEAGSYAGVDKLYRSLEKGDRKEVKKWLRGEDAYTLHKPVRYKFPRNKVVVSGIDTQWDADLMDMSRYKTENEGHTFILLAVDILSHYVWTRALKNKSGASMVKAFQNIFAEGRQPLQIRTDKGTEFKNVLVRKLLAEHHIHFFVTNNEVKANYAERAIRTIKMKLSRYFTHKRTTKWIDVLQDVTESYNKTYHRTIKMKPIDVNEENQNVAWERQYGGPPPHKPDGPFKLDVGDYVRISHLRRSFQKEYDERYTGEIFRVVSRTVRAGLNIYRLKDFLDEEVEGTFYEPELQHIIADPAGVFNIDHVIRSRKRKGHEKEFLIKWLHWPEKFNSWVKSSDMQDV